MRAPALQAGGHRFESCFAHFIKIMKKIIFIALFFSLFLYIQAGSILISLNSGVPLNDFSVNVDKEIGMGIFYNKNIFLTGIDFLSFTGNNTLYSIDIVHFYLGFDIPMYSKNNFSIHSNILTGISIIEKRILDDYERGFNEFLSITLHSDYIYKNNIFPIFTGITKEKIFEGKYYIFIGTAFGFNTN